MTRLAHRATAPLRGRHRLRRALLALALPLLGVAPSGCGPVGILATIGATAGTWAVQERGFGQAISDNAIAVRISEAWAAADEQAFQHIGTSVSEGRVLVTGVVAEPERRVEAIRLVWTVAGVREVINEIQISDQRRVEDALRDQAVTLRLRAAMTFDGGINAVNYSIDTVNGVVYLMGIARDQAELERAVRLVSGDAGVRDVVSHVRLRSEGVPPPPATRPPASAPPAATATPPGASAPNGSRPDGSRPNGSRIEETPL